MPIAASRPSLSECEKLLNYRFKNQEILKKSLTHSSYSNVHIDSNERLEFLGDATLGLVVSNLLYRRFPRSAEGELSQIKSSVVSRKTCRRVASRLELPRFLFLGKGMTSIPDSLVANVMESVIGAIFLDGGYEEARLFVEEHFLPEIDAFLEPPPTAASKKSNANAAPSESTAPQVAKPIALDEAEAAAIDGNFKARLQTRLHRTAPGEIPTYILLDEKGPPHCRCFKVAVQVGARRFQAAWSNNKKDAEQRAAENAVRQLDGQTPPHTDGES